MSRENSNKTIALLVVGIILAGGSGLAAFSWLDGDSDDSPDVMGTLLGSGSVRKDSAPLVVEDDPYLVLASTPVALWYEGDEAIMEPLIVNSDGPSGDHFLQLYPHDYLVGIGDVGDFDRPVSTYITGSREEISLEMARTFWESSDGAIIVGTSNESYYRALPGIVLASYLDIPVIIADSMTSAVKDTLGSLGVEYTIVFGESKGYGTTIRLEDTGSIEDTVIRLLIDRFGGVSYITLTNPRDLEPEYALPGTSSLAPYLTASHRGVICTAPEEPIPLGTDFRVEEDAFMTNETTFRIKDILLEFYGKLEEYGVFDSYLYDSPYMAVMGSAYTLPFYYSYLVPKGIMAGENPVISEMGGGPYQNINDPALVPSDDIYADIDGDLTTHELAIGRPIGINLEDTSAFMARTLFYQEYMGQWSATSPVSMLLDASWEDTAFVHCGDDWNGYVLISSPAYVESLDYLIRHEYTTYTTVGTGETVNEVTRYFESSNLVFVLAHGNAQGFHMIDGYSASSVKNWWVGPSSFVMTSCNVGNTDCPDLTDIDTSIAFAIIRAGVNAYFAGMRYEYTGFYNTNDDYPLVASGSPRLSQIIIDKMTVEDLSSGLALRDAKMQYMDELDDGSERDYDIAIKMLYGDPTFNPYEPYNA